MSIPTLNPWIEKVTPSIPDEEIYEEDDE